MSIVWDLPENQFPRVSRHHRSPDHVNLITATLLLVGVPYSENEIVNFYRVVMFVVCHCSGSPALRQTNMLVFTSGFCHAFLNAIRLRWSGVWQSKGQSSMIGLVPRGQGTETWMVRNRTFHAKERTMTRWNRCRHVKEDNLAWNSTERCRVTNRTLDAKEKKSASWHRCNHVKHRMRTC